MLRLAPWRRSRSNSALRPSRRAPSRPKRFSVFPPRLQSEAAPAAGAPAAQHLASAGRAAAHEKSVASSAPRLGGLIGSSRCHCRPIRKRAVLEPAHQYVVKCPRGVARTRSRLWIRRDEAGKIQARLGQSKRCKPSGTPACAGLSRSSPRNNSIRGSVRSRPRRAPPATRWSSPPRTASSSSWYASALRRASRGSPPKRADANSVCAWCSPAGPTRRRA